MGLYEPFMDNIFAKNDAFEFRNTAKIDTTGQYLFVDDGTEAKAAVKTTEKTVIEAQDSANEYTPSMALQAVESGLESRDVNLTDLSTSDWAVFTAASTQISMILSSDIETPDEIMDLFGDDLDIALVDDFTTTDGMSLDGAAVIDSDKIILDSGLEGDDLRAVLAEEVAETAYQQVFGEASIGDFGAEIVAAMEGEHEDVIAAYSEVAEADTSETEFGTVEAADEAALAVFAETLTNQNAALGGNAEITSIEFSTFEEYYPLSTTPDNPEEGNALGGTADSTFGYSGEWNDGDLIFNENTTVDLDGDGKYTEHMKWTIVNTDETTASVLDYDRENYELLPIEGLSESFLASKAGASNTWVARESETYSVADEINWSNNVEASISLNGFTGTVSSTAGGSLTETTSLTAGTEVRRTVSVEADDYEEGTMVSFGFHALSSDAVIEDNYTIIGYTSDSDTSSYNVGLPSEGESIEAESYFKIEVTESRTIEDYLVGVFATDVAYDLIIV